MPRSAQRSFMKLTVVHSRAYGVARTTMWNELPRDIIVTSRVPVQRKMISLMMIFDLKVRKNALTNRAYSLSRIL